MTIWYTFNHLSISKEVRRYKLNFLLITNLDVKIGVEAWYPV